MLLKGVLECFTHFMSQGVRSCCMHGELNALSKHLLLQEIKHLLLQEIKHLLHMSEPATSSHELACYSW